MFERDDVKFLASFKSDEPNVVSLYLNCDGREFLPKEVYTILKSMILRKKSEVEKIEDKNLKREIIEYLEKIEDHVIKNYREFKEKGLAYFVSRDFFYEIPLPIPPRNRVIVSYTPYILPLQFQRDLYGKVLFILLDKHVAKFYVVTPDKVEFLEDLFTKVPPKVKRGGWQGYDDKKNMRKVDEKTLHHFKRVGEKAFEIFKERDLDGVVVGCKNEYFGDFVEHLHSYLREKLIDNFEMVIDAPQHEIFEKVNNVLSVKRIESRKNLIKDLIDKSKSGGKAVLGLESVVRNLNENRVEHLVILRDYDCSGKLCPDCGSFGVLEERCLKCGEKMIEIENLITEIVDRALLKNIQVTQVTKGLGLEDYGSIGAFLRYKG